MTSESRQLLLLMLFRISRSIAAGMIMLAFPYYVLTSLHYGALNLGFLYSAATLATGVFSLLLSFLADARGRKGALVIAGVLLPVSSALVFVSGRLAVLFAASVLGGYSATGSRMEGGVGGAAQPIQNALIADLAPPSSRTRLYALLNFLSGLASALGVLLARFIALRDTFLVATLIACAGLIFLLPLRAPGVRRNLRRLQSRRTIGKFTLTAMLNGFSQGLVMPFLIPFFVIEFHVPKGSMSVYAFASGALAAVAGLAAPRLERRTGFLASITWTRGLGAALLLFLPFSHFLALALAIYIVTPTLRSIAIPVQRTAMTEMIAPGELGRAMGISQVGRLVASTGAIALTGTLFEASEIAAPFLLYGTVMAANLLLYFRFFRGNPVDERLKASRGLET
jgi:MFS family permease